MFASGLMSEYIESSEDFTKRSLSSPCPTAKTESCVCRILKKKTGKPLMVPLIAWLVIDSAGLLGSPSQGASATAAGHSTQSTHGLNLSS